MRKAMSVLQEGVRDYPGNSELLYRLGVARLLSGNPSGLRDLQQARDLDPDNPSIALALFSALTQLRMIDQADAAMQEYLSRHPEDQQATSLYNAVMQSVGRSPAAAPQGIPSSLPSLSLPGSAP